MKVRESGMPDETLWDTFFTPEATLRRFGIHPGFGPLADFGSGYGTFTAAAARLTGDPVYAIDLEPDMIDRTKDACQALTNVEVICRDFVTAGTGLPDSQCAGVLLFNILHAEDPVSLLIEARRVLRDGGLLAVMHWIPDPATPRGPPLAIRPRPEQCREWIIQAGFDITEAHIDLPPYHFGIAAVRADSIQEHTHVR